MSLLAPAVVIFEKTPRWEPELKRRLDGLQFLVRPCRSAADVMGLCRQAPGSVVIVDLAAGAGEGLQLLESLQGQRLHAFSIVVAATDAGELEWPARELGAANFVDDRLGGDRLAQLCQRALA